MACLIRAVQHPKSLLVALAMSWIFMPSAAQAGGPLTITKALSPTALNVFNFGPYTFKVQYPQGSSFSGINMTVTAVPLSQSTFNKRLAGTRFPKAVCAVYVGADGNCVDFQVTCSDASSQKQIQCPTVSSPSYIDVWTSFNTTQSLINPGFLSAPLGTNSWGDHLSVFFMLKIDPTTHGHTNGFSEFVPVALGVTNQEGLGEFTWNEPLLPTDPRAFAAGSTIPVSFNLASVQNCGQPVTDATASLSVLQIVNAQGNEVHLIVFAQKNVFKFVNGSYQFALPTQTFGKGTYAVTIYGNAFVSQATYFTLQ